MAKNFVRPSFLTVLECGMECGRFPADGSIRRMIARPNRGFAAPAFTHQAQCFASLKRKIYAVYGLNHRPATAAADRLPRGSVFFRPCTSNNISVNSVISTLPSFSTLRSGHILLRNPLPFATADHVAAFHVQQRLRPIAGFRREIAARRESASGREANGVGYRALDGQ